MLGFEMPLPAATSRQFSGARSDRVSPGWTTWLFGECAPAAVPKPTMPMEATAVAAAARFIVLLSKVPSSFCVGETRPRTDGVALDPSPSPSGAAERRRAARRLPGSALRHHLTADYHSRSGVAATLVHVLDTASQQSTRNCNTVGGRPPLADGDSRTVGENPWGSHHHLTV